MAGWVRVFDQSFNRVPISRLHEMYDSGFRVMAGYAGGGSSNKWLTAKEIATWLALGNDTGIAALFEVVGTEPIDNPTIGDNHAKAARAAWRALGYPDNCSISPAVDENVTVAEARAQLTAYFSHWNLADTALPIAYVEMDAGAILFAEAVSAGTFTPAAKDWDSSRTLITPDNAPGHVIWTQEHNAQPMAGGSVDIGHIRLTAPIQWKETEMQPDPNAFWNVNIAANDTVNFPKGLTAHDALRLAALRTGTITNNQLPAIALALGAIQPGVPLTPQQIQAIADSVSAADAAAIVDALNKTHLTTN